MRSIVSEHRSIHILFWKELPALQLALSLLCGVSSYLYPQGTLYAAIWLIYLLFIKAPLTLQSICLSVLGWGYVFFIYREAPRISTALPIEGIFVISSLQPHSSPFHKDFLYKGTLYIPQMVPCSFCVPAKHRPKADQDYWVSGQLIETNPWQYRLKLKKWRPLSDQEPSFLTRFSQWRFAEKRYQWKEQFRKFLRKTTSKETASLLSSLVTGDVEERLLRFEFNRAGLQHLLAISGFHFALLIAFISGSLGLFMPKSMRIYGLLSIISLYFLFVGSNPAVLRSFLTVCIYFIGKLLCRSTSGLNLLGSSMLIELLIDPLASGHIGFQLSFVSCFGLLTLFLPLNTFFQNYLPQRDALELSKMTPLSTWGYLLCTLFRKSLCVTLAVNLALLPLLFYHFHTFPLLGLIYNLFFPLAISSTMFLMLISLIAYALYTPFGTMMLSITDSWTLQLLELISYPPLWLDRSWQQAYMPEWGCICYLWILFFLLRGIFKNSDEFN